jgi:hypothetical protein
VLAIKQAIYLTGVFVLENAKELVSRHSDSLTALQEYQDDWRKNKEGRPHACKVS